MARRSFIVATGRILVVAVAAVVLAASPAAATWSIVAVDGERSEVGAAIASCVPLDVLGGGDEPVVPVVLVPGIAAAVTQGQLNLEAPARIVELIDAGATPQAIVDDLAGEEFDELAALRQHAVVRLGEGVAAHTGADNAAVAIDLQGEQVSVQGNLLVATAVVEAALESFGDVTSGGGELADALVAALLAGSTAGGDRRCGAQTALFAQVSVAGPADAPERPSTLLTVTVDEGDGQNPVELLAEAHERGERGAIDAGRSAEGAGRSFRFVVFVAVGAMLVVGGIALVRGMGSVRARR